MTVIKKLLKIAKPTLCRVETIQTDKLLDKSESKSESEYLSSQYKCTRKTSKFFSPRLTL